MTRVDTAVEPDRGVDAMRQQIARHTAACHVHVEAPQARAALRQILGDGPVLQELGAIVEDLAQAALIDQMLGQASPPARAGNCTRPYSEPWPSSTASTIFSPRGCRGRAAFRTGPSCPPARRRWRFRRACHSGCAMSMRSISLRAISLRQSVSTDSKPQLCGKGLDLAGIARADRLEHRLIFQIEELIDLANALEWVRPMNP